MASDRSLQEITLKAVILGVLLSVILAAANAYLGLFAGMTVSASIPAAVMSMGILRLFRKSNILENNIVQTAASAGEALAAGVIFTIPALVIMDYWESFDYWWVAVIAGFGGLLGVLFTIPLRRALIVEDGLKFPEGIATAEVLESGQQGGRDIRIIVKSAFAGGLFKLGAGSGFGLLPDTVEAAWRFGGTLGYLETNLSPALLAVGYIVGLNIAILILLGGVLNWLIAVPVCAVFQEWPLNNGSAMPALDFANVIWSSQTRYLGVGGMLVGGLWTIFKLRSSILGGIRSGLAAYQNKGGSGPVLPRTEMDMPMKWILILIIGSVVPLFLLYQTFVADIAVSLTMALIMLVTGFLFAAVAKALDILSHIGQGAQEIDRQIRVELLTRQLEHETAGTGEIPGVIVGAARSESVEGIRDHRHLAADIQSPALWRLRVAFQIVSHMMLICAEQGQSRDPFLVHQILGAAGRMLFDHGKFLVIEFAGFVEDFPVDKNLADIMEHPGHADVMQHLPFYAQGHALGNIQDADVNRVGKGIFILHSDRHKRQERVGMLPESLDKTGDDR